MKYLVLGLCTLALLASTMAQNSTTPTTEQHNSTMGSTNETTNSTIRPTTDQINSTVRPTTDQKNSTIRPTTDPKNSTIGQTTDLKNSTIGPTTAETKATWPTTLTTPAGGSRVFSYSLTLLFGSTATLILRSLWQ